MCRQAGSGPCEGWRRRPAGAAGIVGDELLCEAAGVDAITEWSAAAGGQADRAALAALLAEEPERFAGDVFFRLLDTVGLSEFTWTHWPSEAMVGNGSGSFAPLALLAVTLRRAARTKPMNATPTYGS